jgi:hypothetical protein
MQRRKFLAGLGSLAAGSVAAMGTGAFTSVSAERNVSVRVADDRQSFLKLTQRGGGRRSYSDGVPETVGFDIPGPDESDYGGTDPKGVGADSVYRFGSDAGDIEDGLFAAENQGTQPVEVYSTQTIEGDVPEVTIYDVETGNLLTEGSPSEPLGVGERLLCGLEIDTHGVDVREEEYDLTVTINAVATGSD